MSEYKEKQSGKSDKKSTRDSSTSKKLIRDDSRDRKVIIVKENPLKLKSSTISIDKRKVSSEKSKLVEKNAHKVRIEPKNEDKKAIKKESDVSKIKSRGSFEPKSRKDADRVSICLNDILEKKLKKKIDTVDKNLKIKKEESSKKILPEKEENKQEKQKKRRERTRTRTLSPTEIKQLLPMILAQEGDLGKNSKSEEENKIKVDLSGEEVTGSENADEEVDYKEDFEDYESDFEEDEEIQEMPSPSHNFIPYKINEKKQLQDQQMPATIEEQWKTTARKKEIEAIKKSIEKENYNLTERRTSRTLSSEDDSDKENISKKAYKSEQVIDFSKALMKQKKAKVGLNTACPEPQPTGFAITDFLQEVAASRKRGEELLSMISLDSVFYVILEIPPIPYEEFMKTFGKTNSKQVHVQTNEDNLDEETQTDDIKMANKWTQHPPEYLGSRKSGDLISYVLTKEERLGVGEDSPVEEEETAIQPKTNGLWKFLMRASQIILVELERRSGNFLNLDNMPNHSKAMAFGDGFVQLNIKEIPFLKGRSITHLSLLSPNFGKLLSVHVNKEKSFQKSMICVWSFRELSKPLKILIASNRVTSCCFDVSQGNLVFAGLSDGSVCLWDLREPSIYHNRTANCPEWTLQSATYTTVGNLRDESHSGPVVSLKTLENIDRTFDFENFVPMQICSLDQYGTIIIWSVIQTDKSQRNAPSEDLCLAHWGRVKLVKSSTFSVFTSLRNEIPGLYITCNDFIVNISEEDGFYVANSLGSVHHCSSYGSLLKPQFYVPAKQNAIIETTCLEMCPFNGNYFLVGCGDGTIRLHSRHQENPLICLSPNASGEKREAAIVSLNWMRMRPCVFFALDSLSRIHIWDLCISDMYPEISISLSEKRISCMKLLPTSNPSQTSFVVIGTDEGSIEIHRLKKEYGSKSAEDIQNEMKMFLKYVRICS